MTGLTEEAETATAFALAAWAIRDRVRRFLKRRSITAVLALSDRQLNDIGTHLDRLSLGSPTEAAYRWER